jgi:pimeloyl-ACP methyl ester carboxylesterase
LSAQTPYEVSGMAHPGSPIVLVPGGLTGWISWKRHAEILSRDHKVVRVQLLYLAAAERNRRPPEGYSLRSETEALRATLDKLGFQNIHLVGWSHGGEVSLDFAMNYSQRIRTLTLIEPTVYWVTRSRGKYEEEERRFREFAHGLHEPVSEEDLIRFLEINDLIPPNVDPRSLPRWQNWNSVRIALKSVHTIFDHVDRVERLEALRGIPVLLVKGSDSQGPYSGAVDILAELLGPNSRVIVLPDGHACHITAINQFLAEMRIHIEPRNGEISE